MKREALLRAMNEGVKNAKKAVDAFPWEDSKAYASWCAQTFKYVSHSAPLIQLCAERLPAGPMKDEMKKHHKDEVGHERLAFKDAEYFGVDAKNAPELKETTQIYSDIYALIEKNPCAMFGYAMALENISKEYGPTVSDRVLKAYGVPRSKVHTKNAPASFLTLHAEVDQDHAEDGLQALNRIADQDLPFVHEVMQKTFKAYHAFLKANARNSSKAAAA